MATQQRRNRQDAGNEAAEDRSSAPSGRAEAVRPVGPGRAVSPAGVAALQRSAGNAAAAAAVQRSSVNRVLRGPGRPLDASVRGEMEARFGTGFGDVRVHSGPDAERSATEIGARAYTAGSHVVLGRGGGDKHTLAHELTHVVQQRQGPVSGTDSGHGFALSDPGDRFERAAEANAHRVMSGPVPDHGGASDPVQRAAGADSGTVQRALTMDLENAQVSHYTPTKNGAGAAQNLRIERPREVSGPVKKTGTKGRPAAPNPIAVRKLQQAYKGQAAARKWKVPTEADVWRDLFGGAGYDRGHVMGLEVGGVDDARNIVPQWSLNQGTGMWRRMEQALADIDSGTVRFVVHYASADGNHRAVMVPTRIDVYHDGAPYKQWNNEPDTNDLIRSGADPSDLFFFYEKAMDDLGRRAGETLTSAEMDDFVLRALGTDRADMLSHNDYHDARAQGGTPAADAAEQHAAGMSKSAIPADRRKKQLERYVAAGLVTQHGKGDTATYTLHDAPGPSPDSDSSSSSSSDVEMSDGSQSQGQPFMTMTFDSQSSGDEYQGSDDQMSTSP
ncbi:eCIS core domain-containing protein [Streptomyces griseoluteus]